MPHGHEPRHHELLVRHSGAMRLAAPAARQAVSLQERSFAFPTYLGMNRNESTV